MRMSNIEDFVNDQLRSRQDPALLSWTLSQALQLGHLQRHVAHLSLDFASHCSENPVTEVDVKLFWEGFPTPTEIRRIQRTLYRFEIYCNLFRARKKPPAAAFDVDEHRTVFFSKFSPWENEQLGCIHDYLFHKASPVFIEITEHDVTWGATGIQDAHELDSPYIQHILSLGLAKLHAIAVAKTYDERRRLFYTPYPAANTEFLREGLILANERFDGVQLSEYHDRHGGEGRAEHLFALFFREPDTGPSEAWSWAHQRETRAAFVYSKGTKGLRERGYVFWDRSRLETWPVFQSPWVSPYRYYEIEEVRTGPYREKCPRRAQIYALGGRGWWSPSDETKVIYPPGQSPPPVPHQGKGKTSQQPADDFQRERGYI
ncbi:hypothetical protein H2204_000654 [Knufia peltigerae]|uniref:Uncharacterized protein n=1 Tax=Knufia peltigerae TaxID=1002370 RepID=A0AA38YG28_9EURO|nr:hypothetical protein H2204_000654 [Knufia peltigerae]